MDDGDNLKIILITVLCMCMAAMANPVDNRLYARDEAGKCQVSYIKEVTGGGTIQVRVYSGGSLSQTLDGTNTGDTYTFGAEIDAGLTQYKFELVQNGNVLETADNVVCGDAYIVTGQSNASASRCNDNSSEWIRSYAEGEWGLARSNGNTPRAGCWGWNIARGIVDNYQVPVFVINRAKGGSQVVQHLRNDALPGDTSTFYGELLTDVIRAGLKDKIKAVLWHQGENDAALGEQATYIENFATVVGNWRGDYPGVKKVYLFQIFPSCYHRHVVLLDAQRLIPHYLPDVHVMTTLGTIENISDFSGDNCHTTNGGYERWAERMFKLVARDLYNENYSTPVSPPAIVQAWFTTSSKNEIALEFDQDIVWEDSLVPGKTEWIDNLISNEGMQYLNDKIYLDDQGEVVQSSSVAGNTVTLQLKQASNATTVSFLGDANYEDGTWYSYPLIWGSNGVAALSFFEVSLQNSRATDPDQAPYILAQPNNKLSEAGKTVSFRAVASGTDLSYQWMKNGQPIAGATSAYYTPPALTVEDNGSEFSYTVSNNLGSETSDAGHLTVLDKVPAPEFYLSSQFGAHPTWNAKEPITVNMVVTNRDAIGALPEPWNQLNYFYFIRLGENRFLNQEQIDSVTVVITDAKRTNEENPPQNHEDTYRLNFCADNIVYRVCKDMFLTVDTSLENNTSVPQVTTNEAGNPVLQIKGGPRLQLPPGTLRVELYNLSGQKVRSLPVKGLSAWWDGRDEYSRNVTRGIFFISAVGKGISKNFKLVLH